VHLGMRISRPLELAGITVNMSHRDQCWDNFVVESSNSTLKTARYSTRETQPKSLLPSGSSFSIIARGDILHLGMLLVEHGEHFYEEERSLAA